MKWLPWVRDHKWTAFMLLWVIILYSFLLFEGMLTKEDKTAAHRIRAERMSATVELKQQEEAVKRNLLAHPRLMNALSMVFLILLVSGVVLDAGFIRRKMQGCVLREDRLPAAEVCWGLQDIFQGLVFLFFVEGCLFLLQLLVHWMTGLETSSDLILLTNSLIRDICVTLFVLLLIRRRHGRPLSDLGLRARRFFSFVKLGIVSYVGVVPLIALTFVLIAMFLSVFSYEPEPQNVVQIYLKTASEPYLLMFTFFVAGVGPVMEEIFFRGFAYPALRKRFGVPIAAGFTAAVFAAFHMNLVASIPIFFLGLFLCYLYESTGSLVPSIAAHVLHNTLMVLVTLGFKALSR